MTTAGILVIDKPSGMSSHDVVNRVRRCLGTKKVGHAGTLDPDATGVLVLGIGDATRLLEYMVADDKTYEGSITFGIQTDTDDASGQVLSEQDARELRAVDVERAAHTLVGTYAQQVPLYSAVHINGERAYKLARSGSHEDVVLPSREVTIESLDLMDFNAGPRAIATFRVQCSKGTYIRALCRDWGNLVGLPAHMSSLRRTTSGPFTLAESIALSDLMANDHPGQYILPLEKSVSHLHKLVLDDSEISRLAQGQRVRQPALAVMDKGTYAVFNHEGRFWLVADVDDQSCIIPRKVFRDPRLTVDL